MKQWFTNVGERLQEFMRGRNGTDELNRFLLIVALAVLIIGFFFPSTIVALICDPVCLIFLAIIYFRMLSKNLTKRRRENERYRAIIAKMGKPFESLRNTSKRNRNRASAATPYIKENKIYTCKSCGQMLRVPKGKGKVKVTCPKCGTSFIKHT
jgi:predicted RNA-binding Zn-ribbon protein involved in translation (DUF1610 family)